MSSISFLVDQIDAQSLWENKIELQRNEYLKYEGSVDTNLYFVVSGSLRIFVLEQDCETTIRFGYTNDVITALDSFIKGTKSDLIIQAMKKSKLKMISKHRFLRLINSTLDNQKFWHEILGEFIIQHMERERDILTSSPIDRYRRVLKRSPQLFQEVPNKYIASYLRMTPETLSRIKKS